MRKIIVLVYVSLLLTDCSKVPISGRKRINFKKDTEVLPLSFAQYRGFLEQNKLSTNKEMTEQIKNVGARVSGAVDRFMRAN